MWEALLFSIFMPSSFILSSSFYRNSLDESLQLNSSCPASCTDSLSFSSEKILHEQSAFFFQYT